MKILLFILVCLPVFLFGQTPPTANFTATPLSACVGSNVNFVSTSIGGTAAISSYSWDFGDGNSATGANVNHAFNAPGTFTITLVVQAANGQADAEVKTNFITVNPNPTANFSLSTNGCTLPVTVNFTNSSTPGGTYAWQFGNGQTSSTFTPTSQTYATAGNFNVQLIVTNNFGCKDTLIDPIVISDFQAGITAPTTACEGSPVNFLDNSTVGVNVTNWTFTGGSPATSTSSSPSVTWNTPGTYTVTLNAQNTTSGCADSETHSIQILPKPVPTFTATPLLGCAPLPVSFTNTSAAGTSFVWNFGDGTTNFTGQNPGSHTYLGNGTFAATVTMTGTNGCVATSAPVNIVLTSPVASFTSDVVDGCAPLDVQFTSTSTSSIPLTTYTWNFGDGTSFSGQNPPVHTYPVGVYDVSLTVSTASGCIGTVTVQDYIQVGAIDLVNFSIDETPTCAKVEVDFTDLSVISAPHQANEVTYSWDFGDNGTSTLQNPSHPYGTDTGFVDVTLIVNFRGCMDTLMIPDAVYIKAPISFFQLPQTLFCNPASFPVAVSTDDQSKIGKISDDCFMIWNWGDGTQTTLNDADFDDLNLGSTSHNYSAYGTYTIEQVIFNYTTGCSDSTNQTFYISQTNALISPLANDSICVGVSFSLGQNSTSSHPFGTYSWNMGNGALVSGANPNYAYPSSGTFPITLTATNSVGCADSDVFNTMKALANPTAIVTANDNSGCAPFNVVFSNNSSVNGNGVPLESFVFTFLDDNSTQNTTSIAQTVNHTFNTQGIFQVSLVATDQFGCVSSPANTQITISKPTANFSLDSIACEFENIGTLNQSIGVVPLSYQWTTNGVQVSTSPDFTNNYAAPINNVPSSNINYQLIVTDANGCKDTMTDILVISTPIPIIDFTLSGASTNANGDFLCPPVFATFSDDSQSAGDIVSHAWVFGDGKTSSLTNPSNTYVYPGTYSVTMTIIDEYGCSADSTLTDFLTIFGPQAVPDWSIISGLCAQDYNFTLGANQNVSNVIWNLGDGNTVNDSINFNYTYQSVETFNPSVTIFDSNNCQVLYELDPIVIPANGLNAFFTASDQELSLGDEVFFIDNSTFQNSPIQSWTWTLGSDPSFTNNNGSFVSDVYVTPGSQVITLLIEDQQGCFDSYSLTVNVDGTFELPNVFTPNGDDANNAFSFKYNIFESWDIVIVNRWGNVMKEAQNQTGTTFWDGTTPNGNAASDGVYFYRFAAVLLDGSKVKKEGFLELFGK